MKCNCNKRCWAIWAAYYNIFACIPAVVYLLILLITYSLLKDLRPSYDDSYTVKYAKEITSATLFIWCVVESTGIIISIRCVIGIKRERVELVTQYIVWKAILTLYYGIDCIIFCIGTTRSLVLAIYPGLSFVIDVILFIIVFIYYQSMPDDSASEEEDI